MENQQKEGTENFAKTSSKIVISWIPNKSRNTKSSSENWSFLRGDGSCKSEEVDVVRLDADLDFTTVIEADTIEDCVRLTSSHD